MAIYHLHSGFVSRSTGRTSVQSAAYICGEKLHEDYRSQDVDYTKRSHDVVCYKTVCPEHSKYKDLEVWNAVENFENRYAESYFKQESAKNHFLESAQTAQTIVVALPSELGVEVSKELLEKFIDTRFTSRNLISTYAIHRAEGNMHAHVQISRREIGENGEFVNRKDREICTRSALLETRKLWAGLANEYLAREGFKERITEKSFEDLGINLEATKHRGWYADSIGTESIIAQENLEIARRNEEKILSDPSIILDLLNEKKAVFTQKDILREIGKKVFEEKHISAVFEKALEEAKYVGESINGEFLYTGEKYQKLESDVLTKFDNLSSKTSQISCVQVIKNEVLSRYDYLSEEQKSAVIGLTDNSNFVILLGKAGAGKTTTMRAISEIYAASGSRVIGMSLSAVASENLGKDACIESATIASWAHRWRVYETAQDKFLSFDSVVTDGVLKQLDWYNDLKRYEGSQLKSGDVIVVDEAGMVGTKDWNEVLSAAEKFGAKIIAVGDDNQFKAISSGDCFRQFIDQKQDNVLELSEIRRQKEDWQREASADFSKLNAGEGLAKYEHHGKLHAVEDSGIHSQIAEKYLEIEGLGSAAVLCSTRAQCSAINDAVRVLKKKRGELGKTVFSMQITSNNRVSCKDFSMNDRVMFLQNDKRLDVKNGQVGIVNSFSDGILSVQTESGIRNIDTSEYDKIDHAYAITLHKSQGKTYDNTIVLANKLMDAKAFYVGMTRHRENVDLYYNKSDFGSFKALAASASKYVHKDSLEDYRSIENQNKARVFEYKEVLLETASVLKDINKGEADWREYYALKSRKLELGKEILSSYKSHRLYLGQLGITKENLEISVGLKQRPLSGVELNAKNIVALYAKVAADTREEYAVLTKSAFNIKMHPDYEKYCGIRELRNDLAKEILLNYPLHREFVKDMSKEFFISKKSMENQVNYAESVKAGKIQSHNYSLNKAAPIFRESQFLQRISEMKIFKQENEFEKLISLPKPKEFIESEQKDSLYILSSGIHKKTEGYALHVSNSMLNNYLFSHGIEIQSQEHIYKYASILVQKEVGEQNLKEVPTDLIESSLKQAVCFEALKNASGNKELTPEAVNILHSKAEILSEKLNDENIRILNNKELMKEANSVISIDSSAPSLLPERSEQIMMAHESDVSYERSKEISQAKELEKSKEFELSM